MKKKVSKKHKRLSVYTKPTYYNITIKPDLDNLIFLGNEKIEIEILKETKEVFLHSKDLKIKNVELINKKEKIIPQKIKYNQEQEIVTFIFPKKIKKGKYEIVINFEGLINDKLKGFYQSRYKTQNEEKTIATTQFEATDARMAFPCFDEPEHKAIFEISLIIKNHHEAISNTMPTEIKPAKNNSCIDCTEDDYKIVSFSPTPKMSTYLLAFIIGEFESIEGYTKEGIQIRVFTTIGKIHQAKFALQTAIKSIEFYNEYFDIPYPMPNLDLIAIPDFVAVAMENWGAITFRETSLLVDEKETSLSSKQWIAAVIAHEIAHQWFGNLVTMKWWTDLWLNEGFATYMEHLCLNDIFPNWHIWNLVLCSHRLKIAQKEDSLKDTHPIEVKVHHPDEINEIFDMVSYEKGSMLIHMLATYLSQDVFRDGLRYYLKKHNYKNTETKDLWDAFEKISAKPIAKIMNSWTKQKGHPIVKIEKEDSKIKITQDRFFLSRISEKENKEKYLWQIPFNFEEIKNDTKADKEILIDKKKIYLDGEIGIANKGQSSFIKVLYDKDILDKIKEDIKKNKVSEIDKFGIIKDLFYLAESGKIKLSEVLSFIEIFKNDREHIIISEIANQLNKIYKIIIKDTKIETKYQKYVRSIFSKIAEEVTFEKGINENENKILLRNIAISQSAFYGDKEIIKEAKKIWDNKIIKPIDKDIKEVIYQIIAKNGNEKDWNMFLNDFHKTNIHEEKNIIIKSMAQFTDKKLLKKTLDFVNQKEVRDQDKIFGWSTLINNTNSKDITLKYLKNDWKNLLHKYGSSFIIQKIIASMQNMNTEKDLKDIKKFWGRNKTPGASRTLKQTYEIISSNIIWKKNSQKDIENWLNKNY